MASKPLHVRRLQKALQEWVQNPGQSNFLTLVTTVTTLYCSKPSDSQMKKMSFKLSMLASVMGEMLVAVIKETKKNAIIWMPMPQRKGS